MTPVQKAQQIGERMMAEKMAQQLDYEHLQRMHNRKMFLRALKTQAKALDSLFTNLSGKSLWGK